MVSTPFGMMADANLSSQQVHTSFHSHTALEDEMVVGRRLLVWREVMDYKESTFGGCLMGLLEVGQCRRAKTQLHQDSFFHETYEKRHPEKCSSTVLMDFLDRQRECRAACSAEDRLAEVVCCL